jgi:hypothetical protein
MSRKNKNKGKRKKQPQNKGPRKISVSKQILEKMRAVSRIQGLEQWAKSTEGSREAEAKFQAHMMFSINSIVEALVAKGVLTMEDLNEARIKVIADYKKEEAERAAAEKAAEEQAKKEAETKAEGESEGLPGKEPEPQQIEASETPASTPESPSEPSQDHSEPSGVVADQPAPVELPLDPTAPEC